MKPSLLAFASGFTYEALSVLWVHQATHGTPLATALVSALQCAAMLTGIIESISGWAPRCALVVGYGAGAFVAMVGT